MTLGRSDIHYVVTEFGIAYLFGKSVRERAIALIAIAHPDFRDALLAEAQRAASRSRRPTGWAAIMNIWSRKNATPR